MLVMPLRITHVETKVLVFLVQAMPTCLHPQPALSTILNRRTERQSPAKGARSYCKWLCSDVRSKSVKASLGTRRAFCFCAQGNLTIYAWLLSNIYKWRFSSLEPWQNLRRLRLHLRTVWSGDTRSILLQPMGRMERTDSRPRNALIHRESGSPPDYLPTPGSSVSSRAHISVQAAPRFFVFFFCAAATSQLRARCVCESTLSYTRAETLLELMQGMFICSEIASCGRKERWSGVTAAVWLRPSAVWHTRCIIPESEQEWELRRADLMAQRLKTAPRALPLHFLPMCSEIQTWLLSCLHVSAAEDCCTQQ